MGITTKAHLPLVSATKFNVEPQSVGDETDYTTYVGAGTGDWVLGSALPKGRKLLVIVETGALTGVPTGLKFGLMGSATDANGSSGAIIASTATEVVNPAGDTVYVAEIDLAAVDDLAKFYSLGIALKGGGTTAVIVGATALVLDPTYG
jgi:hypothetical protein